AFGAQFNQSELRYIFLHELAHVKRGDLWLNWLVTVLQILHWFNPLLWLGFARLRADRELACDELALLRAGDSAGMAYGETIVKLLEGLSRPAAVPGLIGILEDKQQMRRRIAMISNFRRPGRWSALAAVLLAIIAAVSLTDAQTSSPAKTRIKVENDMDDVSATNSKGASNSYDSYFTPENNVTAPISGPNVTNATIRPDLTGTVTKKDGSLLPTRASVFIATAAPKTGTSTFCPSCYADCVKHAQTDAQGHFKIESLDPQLTFRILAVAKGYQPKSVSKVDPAKGPATIELKPMNDADAAPDHSLRGRVLDAKGNPVEGAVVEMVGTESKDGGGSYGALPGIDPLAVTDENGEFLITSKKPFDMMDVKVSARTFADKSFTHLPSGKTNDLLMTQGATITGRVLADGKPLAGITVGISGVDRQAGFYVGHFEISTDARGKFAFINVPPDVDFWIYTTMSSMKQYGAVPIRQIHSDKDGATTDVGDLIVEPAHRLAGRVKLADGQPLPPKVRLLVSRDQAWDSMQITLDAGGHFDVKSVPNELVTLSARVKDYHVSARNLSADLMNPYQLIGRVDRDITNLVFLLEKGPTERPDYRHVDPDYTEIRNRTLRGAESDMDHSHDWTISGRVLDKETKQPVTSFDVTPGQMDDWNRTAWSALRVLEGSNGVYTAYLSRRTGQPLLKVEADGYLPASRKLSRGNATNVDFLLQKGDGPSGTVVTSDGKPATGASVVLLTGEMNEAGFNSAGELTAYGSQSNLRMTDANG
ncbi:MAG TPA: M56 family metallopeptidase, partial [Candidatus Binatia bacterium]|nr:M56 family metallopeptidase [Candidatus Binatia bacterium]